MPLNMGDFNLNKDIPIPLYYQLKQQILEKILSSELKVDEQIPIEIEMVAVLNVSRSTVRQAINELVAEGYLYRIKAKGTFVSKPKVDENFFQKLESFNQEMLQKGLTPSTKVLTLKAIPGIKDINKKLGIAADEKLIYLCRLRYANGEPIVYFETYISYDRYTDLLREDFESGSLYSVLELKYNTRVIRALREIEATIANSTEAKFLDVRRNSAICLVKTVAYTCKDVPVEYSVARYRGDRNKFTVELVRK